jgi:hypothetical protein
MIATRLQRKIFRIQVQNVTLHQSVGGNLRRRAAFDVYRIHVTIVERARQKPGGFKLQDKQYLNIISNTMRSLQNDRRVLKQNCFSQHC